MSMKSNNKGSGSADLDLIVQAFYGDREAYGALYDRYVDAIYRYISMRVSTQEDAEDLTEMVFLKTFEKLRSRSKPIDYFSAWLYRCAHNLVIDHYRTYKQNTPLEQVEAMSGLDELPEGALLRREERFRLIRALHKLESAHQQVLLCRFINNMSYSETAQIMNINEGHLRVLQYRALQKLLREMDTDNDQTP
jgi:RNA polymerase sigma-70 factor (ECF subfamily)